MEEEALELYELQYSDLTALLLFDQTHYSDNRLQSISNSIIQNLGPNGPGLLSVAGVPKAQSLRQAVLPLARKLALLNHDHRKSVLKGQNLGSDVPLKNPDRAVSSFAMQMRSDQGFDGIVDGGEKGGEVGGGGFEDLGFMVRELGFCMMELGLLFARVCDKLIGGFELEHSLLECGTAKGRLIHYHSVADSVAIKEGVKGKRRGGGGKGNFREDCRLGDDDGGVKLWQQWHYDYGIFTILTSPMFVLSNGSEDGQECESPSGNTYLQVYHPGMRCVKMVKASKGSLIVQVGEAADVLSKGKVRATLHSVSRPAKMDCLSREAFVVFLQPVWSKILSFSDEELRLREEYEDLKSCNEGMNGLSRDIHGIVPPLSSRLRNGMTFAEFSRETTKQYYGGGGSQSNRLDIIR